MMRGGRSSPGGGLLRDGEAGVLTYPYQQEQRDGGEDAEKGGQSDPGSAPLPPVSSGRSSSSFSR